MTEPTTDQCTANAPIPLPDGRTGYAIWYPQMGGYTSCAIVVADDGGCFDAWIWHNGDFPFAGRDVDPIYGDNPRELHHCDPGQFVAFGQTVERLLNLTPRPPSEPNVPGPDFGEEAQGETLQVPWPALQPGDLLLGLPGGPRVIQDSDEERTDD